MSHYSDGRRFSEISQTWILASSWNEREEVASLKVQLARRDERVAECEHRLSAEEDRADGLQRDAARWQWFVHFLTNDEASCDLLADVLDMLANSVDEKEQVSKYEFESAIDDAMIARND